MRIDERRAAGRAWPVGGGESRAAARGVAPRAGPAHRRGAAPGRDAWPRSTRRSTPSRSRTCGPTSRTRATSRTWWRSSSPSRWRSATASSAEPAAAARLDLLADFLAAAVERAEVQREVDRLTTLQVERGRREYLLRAAAGGDPRRAGRGRRAAGGPRAEGAPRGAGDAGHGARPRRCASWSAWAASRRRRPSTRSRAPTSTGCWRCRGAWRWRSGGPIPRRCARSWTSGTWRSRRRSSAIVEYLAVRRLAPEARPPILCFVGPPGVGKTSLGRAIADALGRPFGRMSLGGVDDEAVIRGHRRTYVGAMPGKIVQEISRARRDEPGADDRRDRQARRRPRPGTAARRPRCSRCSIPSRTCAFVDHYLNVPFDLSRGAVHRHGQRRAADPGAAARPDGGDRDPGVHARGEGGDRAQAPAAAAAARSTGSADAEIAIDDDALALVASGYAREAGVRGLKRDLAALLRRAGDAQGRRAPPGPGRSTRS